MCDVAADSRWGRVSEGAGEDPYLGSRVAESMVAGYQGDDLSDPSTILACVKHFAAYGAAEAGREYNTVDMSEMMFRNLYLPPYKAAVDAGAGSVMSSFNDFDGLPAIAGFWMICFEVNSGSAASWCRITVRYMRWSTMVWRRMTSRRPPWR